jgi:beta-fructofuranosidase
VELPEPDALARRAALAEDHHRPLYHFLPPANWMNDPNGAIEWQGRFHLFYQYNPHAAVFGQKHWGHAVSDDLVHWEDLPLALTPTPGGPDGAGCWSGCMVDDRGTPTIIYTAVRDQRYQQQTQCLATSDDDLLTWVKDPANPVLSEIPAVTGATHDFRDPCVWWDGQQWSMALSSRVVGVGGAILLFRSPDLHAWEYQHPLLIGSAATTGDVWECPSFFPLGDKWVLIVAGKGRNFPFSTFYFVGDYTDRIFTPETEGVLDHGYLYAPMTMTDNRGRRLLWAWLREGRSAEAHGAAGWAGVQMIPRELRLYDGTLFMEPVTELERLRGDQFALTDVPLDGQEVTLPVSGRSLDIEVSLMPSGPVTIALACASDGSEETRITYDPQRQELIVNREQSGESAGSETFPHVAPHALAPGETLDLRILLDGSVVELIANGRTSIATRIYPARPDSQAIRVTGHGLLKSLQVWQMAAIWPR